MGEHGEGRLSELFPKESLAEVFESLFENAGDAIYILDTRGNLVAVNHKAEEITGFKREDFIGESFRKTISAKDLPKAVKGFLEVLGGKSIKLELELKTATGKPVPTELTSTPLVVKGKIVGIFGIIREITEQVLTEKKLQATNRRLETILETAMEGITLVDSMENLTFVNRAFAEMLGYKESELLGVNLRKIVDEDTFGKLEKQTEARMKGRATRYTLILRCKNGEPRYVQVSAAPLWNDDGSFVGSIGIVLDVTEQKRAEKLILESQQKFRGFFIGNPEATVYVDPRFHVLDVNPRFEEFFGYSLDEIKGKYINDVVVPKNLKDEAATLDKKAEKGYVYHDTVRERKDGSLVQVSISAAPIIVENQLIGYVGIYKDISIQKKAEERIRESEERHRSLVESTGTSIATTDWRGRFTFVNDALCNTVGYSKNELIGKPFVDFIHPDDKKRILSIFLGAFRHPSLKPKIEFRAIHKSGNIIHMHSSPTILKYRNKIVGFNAIITDITKLKEAEIALRSSEEKFRNIFEGANDAIVYGDSTGRVLGINRKGEEVAGVKREEIVGKHFWKLGIISPRDVPNILNRLKSRMIGKPTSGFELVIKSKDGKTKFLEVNVATLRRGALPVGFMAIIRDATERKQMMTKLEEYSQQLEVLVEKKTRQLKEAQEQLLKAERLATIGQVAAMVGHDLRNPLTGIAGAVYYLKMKLDSQMDEKSKEMLRLIEKDIEHSNMIINDLLDFSREVRLELKETNVRLILDEVLSVVKVPDNVQLTDDTHYEPVMRVDVEKIKRVFANIIKNAVDAMPQGGKLTIKSRSRHGNVEIVFTDTGTGMSKEVMEKIWTPFFTTKAKGMGLGLPICKRFAEAHGGNISVESTVGKGTTFTVAVPLKSPKSKEGGGEKVWVTQPESWLSTTMRA